MTVSDHAEGACERWCDSKWDYSNKYHYNGDREEPTVESTTASMSEIEDTLLPELVSMRVTAEAEILDMLEKLKEEHRNLITEVENRESKIRALFKEYNMLKPSYAEFCKREIANQPQKNTTYEPEEQHVQVSSWTGTSRSWGNSNEAGGYNRSQAQETKDYTSRDSGSNRKYEPRNVEANAEPDADGDEFKPRWASNEWNRKSPSGSSSWQKWKKDESTENHWNRDSYHKSSGWESQNHWEAQSMEEPPASNWETKSYHKSEWEEKDHPQWNSHSNDGASKYGTNEYSSSNDWKRSAESEETSAPAWNKWSSSYSEAKKWGSQSTETIAQGAWQRYATYTGRGESDSSDNKTRENSQEAVSRYSERDPPPMIAPETSFDPATTGFMRARPSGAIPPPPSTIPVRTQYVSHSSWGGSGSIA
jgi:hypothetical protein